MHTYLRTLLFAAVAATSGVLLLHPPENALTAIKRPHFSDIASQSNVSYITNDDFQSRKYFPQPLCGGIAILDYDQDGLMDIFFTNGAKLPELKKVNSSFYNCLLRNKGDGTFEDVTKKAGVSALSGLASKPPDTLSVQGAWFDYDNDGLLDLVVSNYTLWTPETDRRCQRGNVELYCSPTTYTSVPNRLYHNVGNGKFEDVTERSGFGKARGKGMGICIADFNRDGWQDVFIANDTEPNFLYLNQRNGTFKEAGLLNGVAYNESGSTVSAMGCDAKDYDNDGWVDIFYNNLMGQTWGLFRNQHGKSFRYTSPLAKLVQLSGPYS